MPKITSSTKPLKPYRRGETLGKASRSGKPSKTSSSYVKPVVAARRRIVKEVEIEDDDEDEDEAEEEDQAEEEYEDEEMEDEEEEEEIAFDDEELLGDAEEEGEAEKKEEEEEVINLPVLPMKRKSGKKGRKFIESQSALLSLIASITGDQAITKKAKLLKVKAPPKESEKELKLQREALKKKQLDAAKAIVSAQTRAKKVRRNDREVAKKERAIAVETGEVNTLARKRVSFA